MNHRTESTVLAVLIAVGVLAALVGVKARFSAEQHNKRTEIVIDYTDALDLALAARKPLDATLIAMRSDGVTTLALWEDPLDNLRLDGAMRVQAVTPDLTDLVFSPQFPGQQDRVVAALKNKTSVSFSVSSDTILAHAPYNQISALGVGLDPTQVATALSDGFLISPRLFNYSGVSPTSIEWMLNQVKTQCKGRANVVIFNGSDVLGDRGEIAATAAALRSSGLLYGSLELGKQGGDDELSRIASDVTVRVHSIGGNEMPTMEESTAVARFALAARERNIRSCYVRLFQNGFTGQPDIMAANLGYIRDIVDALHDGGLTIGAAHGFAIDPRPGRAILILMGLGAAAAGVLLLRQFFSVSGSAFWILLILAIIAGTGLAALHSILGREIDAFVAAASFPTLGLILCRPPLNAAVARTRFRALESAFRTFELMTGMTLLGIILVVGLLADRLMMLKVYEFLGIRLAIVTPLLLYLIYEGLGLHTLAPEASGNARRAVIASRWRAFTGSPLLMGQVVFGVIALALLGLIILRSGNDPDIGVTSSELSFRALLNRIFYVRPRTKEIFFAYPLFVAGLAFYYSVRRRWYLLFVLAGAIGLADLQNTFCHIHTPLLISFIRGMLGWIIGLVFGVVLFLVVDRYISRPRVVVRRAGPEPTQSVARESLAQPATRA